MDDILKNVTQENNDILNKYSKSIIKRGNVEFYPYVENIGYNNKTNEELIIKTYTDSQKDKDYEDFIEVFYIDSHKADNEELIQEVFLDLPEKENEIKSTKPISQENKDNNVISIDDYIDDYIEEEDDEYLSMFTKKIDKDSKFKEKLSSEVSQDIDKIKENKTKEELKSLAIQNEAIIRNIYGYLFDTIYKFYLVYDDLKDNLKDFKDMKVVEKTELATPIDVETYLKRFRSGSLILKFNLIAFQLGKYNYEILMNNLTEESLLIPDKELFAKNISQLYNGTDIDISYLNVFHEIVKAEESGLYVFEDNKVTQSSIKQNFDDSESKKGKLGLSPFKLKK